MQPVILALRLVIERAFVLCIERRKVTGEVNKGVSCVSKVEDKG